MICNFWRTSPADESTLLCRVCGFELPHRAGEPIPSVVCSPCVHLGPIAADLPAEWLVCGCSRVLLFECRATRESVTVWPLDERADAAAKLELSEYHGRCCAACDLRQGTTTEKPPCEYVPAGGRVSPALPGIDTFPVTRSTTQS